ncbi:MAG: DUF4127 family protein [Candidatus Gastranaerophilales bacterium]|nr:DUF4127 family protein [Candidatus Gastranaerophilales bacterium]
MKIAFLPIDNRPVCYTLPEMIAKIDSGIEFFIPERELLGGLTKTADIEGLFKWLVDLPELDAIVLSLDTIAYGGLIPSRRCPETFEQIRERVKKLKQILLTKNCKIYAFSSIMRISNNNYNVEEKEYWKKWGKKLFDYSYHTHKCGCESCISNRIPSEILDDYLETRKRNFKINKIYLQWQKEGLFETLVFSKDDCARYGFNVQEAQFLESLGGFIKTGADEIPLTLLARAITGDMKVCPIFLEPEGKNLISNYEDVSVEQSVLGQLDLAGINVGTEQETDIILYVNNFIESQGEIVMKEDTESFSGKFNTPDTPYMIADVRFANGADNNFIDELFKNEIDENFYGYSGWNTTANSLGSLICAAKVKFFAKKYNPEAFENLQAVRFLDDWAYQANVRQILDSPDVERLMSGMENYEKIVGLVLNRKISAKYSYPWERLFEVEVELN